MHKKLLIFLIVTLALGVGVVVVFLTEQVKELGPSGTPTPTPTNQPNITVFSPARGGEVILPFVVLGQARVFENMLSIRLVDPGTGELLYRTRKLLFQSSVYANAPDVGQFGPFEQKIDYLIAKPAGEDVVLEAYDNSAKDGSEIDLVSIPLKLSLNETTTVKIFFNNSELDPEFSCNKVFPVQRLIAKTQTPARKALELLLEGPSQDEKNQEFLTSINSGVKIQSLTVQNGVAKVDFDEQLEYQVGGSCRVSAIRSQITETLKQFPTVENVLISINGRTEDILQP
jgi:hypothetical protein